MREKNAYGRPLNLLPCADSSTDHETNPIKKNIFFCWEGGGEGGGGGGLSSSDQNLPRNIEDGTNSGKSLNKKAVLMFTQEFFTKSNKSVEWEQKESLV